MPYEYEYETAGYGDYGYTHGPVYDYTPGEYYHSMMTGFPWVIANIQMIVLCPAVMVLNLILFIAIVRSEKIRSEPWRWLIAHTSFMIVIMNIIGFLARLTYIYHVPSLHTTLLCPFMNILLMIVVEIVKISFALVAIERFRALQLGKENEGGMGKKAVILSLSLFWLFVVLMETIPLAVEPIFTGLNVVVYSAVTPDLDMCYVMPLMVPTLAKFVLMLWVIITLLSVIIGTIVLACRKTTTPEMKASIVAPTLAFTIIWFFFSMGPEVVYSMVFPRMSELVFMFFGEINAMELFLTVSWISFPIIWLVTWSRSGDICWRKISPCCHGDDDEKRRLLEA